MIKIIVGILFFSLLYGCTESNSTEKVSVVASFYPIYDFTKNVGGDRVEVTTLIPHGTEPHEFEPSVSDIRKLSTADIFLYNGGGLEPWAENVINGLNNNDLYVKDTSLGISLLNSGNHEEHQTDNHLIQDVLEDEHHHIEGVDPHFWLDPKLAKIQVNNIRDALVKADPEGKSYYDLNAKNYNDKLDSLDAKIRATMARCKKHDILVTHATLGYFCKSYSCNQIAINGVDPEAEPSPSDLAKIIDQARENNISVVFFETLIDPRSAQTISEEINGSVLAFNSVHGLTKEEELSGEDYLSLMEGNLANIKKGLECE